MADYTADVTRDRIIAALTSPTVAENVIETWGGHLQRAVGRAVIRALLWIAGALLTFGAVKAGLLEKWLGR